MKKRRENARKKSGDDPATDLRRKAEEALKTRKISRQESLPHAEVQALLHELQVHQIELEMQNAELEQTRADAESLRDRYIDLYDFAPVGYLTLDGQGTILEANLAGSMLLWKERSLLIGQRFPAFLDNASVAVFTAFCERVIKNGGRQTCEVRLRKNAAGPRVLLADGGFMQRGTGTSVGIRVALTDITERKRLEDALTKTNKQLSLLAGITRHDIRNQLFSLKAYLELSKKTLGDAAKTLEYIIKEERAADAIEHQIIFTKEYQDLGVKVPVWANIGASVKKVLPALPLRDVKCIVDRADREVLADPLFEKVFYNLLDNALRYGGQKLTTIRITSQESGQGLVVFFEDDGVGILAEDKKRLFERGFGKNTGLGLFLSREILSMTGITITETGEPGKGARFEIVVPKGAYRFTGAE